LNISFVFYSLKSFYFSSFINPLDEQFVHLQIHPPQIMTTPMSYAHPTQMINPHIPITSFNHLHPSLPPPPYAIATGPAFYQASLPSATAFQQHLTTPYHLHHPPPQIVPGLPPHAPIAPQRTVNFNTTNNNNTNTYNQQLQGLSPTSIQVQEMNIQALQQRITDQQKHQQTPISIQRLMNRMPTNGYTQ
jgi:hypothetical protein